MSIRHRASVVCVHQNQLLVFDAIDPVSGQHYLFIPGGKIEDGETPAQAAKREAREETGYEVAIDEPSEITASYGFRWKARDYQCLTHFFRAKLLNLTPSPLNEPAYHQGARWLPLKDVQSGFAYHPTIQQAILSLLA